MLRVGSYLSGWLRGLQAEVRTAAELLVVAACVWCLPWAATFRVLRWLTRFPLFQGVGTDVAERAMQEQLAGPRAHALRVIALHRLVDIADYFVSRKYGDTWAARYLHVSGSSLPEGEGNKGALFVTFHFGQGFWALRYLRDKGYPVAWLHAPPPLVAPLGEKLSGWMGRRRIRQVARLSGASTIAVGGSVERMRTRLLEEHLPVMIMPDAPLQPGQSSVSVRLLGQEARLPGGAIRMAAQSGVPVWAYSIVVDPRNGHRHMRIVGPACGLDEAALAQFLADCLQSALDEQPEAWHVWPWAKSFLRGF